MHTDLWNYALALYAQPGVEAACLRLQDEGGDVCLLLCGAWLQARQVTASEPRVAALLALAGPWQRDVIAPLRQLRQQWRKQAEDDPQLAALRARVKGLELEAERGLLGRLEQQAAEWPGERKRCSEDWLARLMPGAAMAEDALQHLRVSAQALQDGEDVD
ncbi:MAG TPA: TIGR02444 family protein [Pseudomonas sp.]|uniref:TIGR02444 family protein n=1 Tax=Pseudomonas sp. TaxID=306 RepID=UPI002B479C83|nr:TIGR02444 family protein [Pseudomonas sp.]HKS14929.1 TIGR02444 family protein [Pseudomonas sp.]